MVIIVPILIYRKLKGQPLLGLRKKREINSPKIFYIGMILFAAFTLLALYINKPYYAIFTLIIALLYLIGLIAFKKGWRG
jgi:hypothetical protein